MLRAQYVLAKGKPRSISDFILQGVRGNEAVEALHSIMDWLGPEDLTSEDVTPQFCFDICQITIGMRDHPDDKERGNAIAMADAVIEIIKSRKGTTNVRKEKDQPRG